MEVEVKSVEKEPFFSVLGGCARNVLMMYAYIHFPCGEKQGVAGKIGMFENKQLITIIFSAMDPLYCGESCSLLNLCQLGKTVIFIAVYIFSECTMYKKVQQYKYNCGQKKIYCN